MNSFFKTPFAALLSLVILGLVGTLPAHAQEGGSMNEGSQAVDQPVQHQGSLNLSINVPGGGLSNALSGPSIGGDLSYGYRLFELSSFGVYGGGDLDFGTFGGETLEFYSSDDVTYRLSTLVFQPQISIRLQPTTGLFRPFVEGLVGYNILFSAVGQSGPESGQTQTPTALQERADEGGAAASFGIGAGLNYRFARIEGEALGLALSVQYIYGGQTDVPVVQSDGTVTVTEESTSVIQPEIGVYFDF